MFWDTLVENRIREAMRQGAFTNLPGAGKPIPDLNEPYDELWWLRKWLRREGIRIVPESVARRREFLARIHGLWDLADEAEVRRAVAGLNTDVARWNATTTQGPTTTIAGLDPDETVRRWRARKSRAGLSSSPTSP